LHKELSDREAELREKTDALADAQEKCKGMSGRCEEAEKILADYGQFEKNIQAQKKSFQDTEQRIREMKIKLRVLSEKAKENVEALARFAESKEFDEFRKSVHLDELTQKYEDQVKDLSRPSHPQ
jgi:DNA repair ATPase RecN